MKQCENCWNKPYKDKLFCCACSELLFAFNELFKQLPLFGKHVQDFECGWFISEKGGAE